MDISYIRAEINKAQSLPKANNKERISQLKSLLLLSEKITNDKERQKSITLINLNLSYGYLFMKKYSLAIQCLIIAQKINPEPYLHYGTLHFNGLFGHLYYCLGLHNMAVKKYLSSIPIIEKLKNKYENDEFIGASDYFLKEAKMLIYMYVAQAYSEIGKIKKARNFINKSMSLWLETDATFLDENTLRTYKYNKGFIIMFDLEILIKENNSKLALSKINTLKDDGFLEDIKLKILHVKFRILYKLKLTKKYNETFIENKDIFEKFKKTQDPIRVYQIYYWMFILLRKNNKALKYYKKKEKLKIKKLKKAIKELNKIKFNELSINSKVLEIKEIEKIKSDFFTNITHELRTPLSLIISPLEESLKTISNPKNKIRIQQAHSSSLDMLDLVNQLLDLNKIESNLMKSEKTEFDLINLMNQIFNKFFNESSKKKIEFVFESSLKKLQINSNKYAIERIITNLLSNAFKFTAKNGKVKLSLKHKLIDKKDISISLTVEDNGIGIKKSDQEFIFNRFHQIDSNLNSKVKGTGIGLSLVKEFSDLMNAKLNIKSALKKGTEFSLDFKSNFLDIKEEKHSLKSEIVKLNIPIKTSLKENTVLIVEDNDELREYLINELKDKYNIINASDGVIALEKIEKKLPDLIVSDVMMPNMDGNVLCKEIKTKEETSHLPVILLTAKTLQKDKIKGIKNGANIYMNKPFSIEELSLNIDNLISLQKSIKEKYKNYNLEFLAQDKETISLYGEFIEKLHTIIKENYYKSDFNVEILSQKLFVNRVHLSRKTKSLLDSSPSELISNYRLSQAKHMLDESKIPKEVAYSCGFNSTSYFSTAFKKKYKKSPSEYKRVG